MGLFDFLFKNKSNIIQEYLDKGAVVLDVRTQQEYNEKHFDSTIHIPLSELKNRVEEIKKLNRPVIAHCRAGIRSEKAKQFLVLSGIDAINGGSYSRMKAALKQ